MESNSFSDSEDIEASKLHSSQSSVPIQDGWTRYLFFVGSVTVLSSFAYGYNISAIDSPKAILEQCIPDPSSNFIRSCVSVGEYWNYIVAGFSAGGLIGALSTGSLTKVFGRKRVLIAHNIPYLLGTALLALAPNFPVMILGRILIGLAAGICTVVVPMYLAEISPDRIRGTVCIMHQGAIVLGIIIAQGLAFPLSNADGWRLFFLFPGIFSLLQFLLLPLCPESPKYLITSSDRSGATKSLEKLRHTSEVGNEIAFLEAEKANLSTRVSLSIPQLLFLPSARKSVIVGITFHAIQQFSGINAVFLFSTSIFTGIGVPEKIVSILNGILNVLMTGVSIVLMDRAGRRPLTLVSTLAMGLGSLGIVLSLVLNWSIVCLLFSFLFVGGFALGLGPVPWVILGDIFPSSAVDSGVTIAIAVNWTAHFILAISLLQIKNILGSYLFLVFAAFLFSFLAFTYVYIPETKGKSSGFL